MLEQIVNIYVNAFKRPLKSLNWWGLNPESVRLVVLEILVVVLLVVAMVSS